MDTNSIILQDVEGQNWSFVLRDGVPFVSVPSNEREVFSNLFPGQVFWFGINDKWLDGKRLND